MQSKFVAGVVAIAVILPGCSSRPREFAPQLAAATIVLLPFAVLGGAWGMSKMKRTKKEKAIKTAMTGCLSERGYAVTGWQKTGRKVPKVVSKPVAVPAAQAATPISETALPATPH